MHGHSHPHCARLAGRRAEPHHRRRPGRCHRRGNRRAADRRHRGRHVAGLQGSQTAITDENGHYKITNLPPGDYLVTFYYADLDRRAQRHRRSASTRRAPVYLEARHDARPAARSSRSTARRPTIDPTSTTQGITIDSEYTASEHPGPGPHVRVGPRRRGRLAGRRRWRLVLGLDARSRTSTSSTASTRPA